MRIILKTHYGTRQVTPPAIFNDGAIADIFSL